MAVTPALRTLQVLGLLLPLALLMGCSATSIQPERNSNDYFARQLPGLPDDWDPMMSSADRSFFLDDLRASPSEQLRLALLDQHQRWVGTPYRLGGESTRGIDCSALVQRVFAETFRLELPRTTGDQVREGEPVDRDALQVGDLVFFRPPGAYDHVGIYVGEGHFLHASTSQGVKLSRLDNVYWQRHFWQARRTLAPTLLAQRVSLHGEG